MATGISVVMPVRNGGRLLATAVESVLQQTHRELELLLINDHSCDNAIQELRYDSRIRIIDNQGSGLVDALNTGLNSAGFDFIARMDADDVSHHERFAQQLQYLTDNKDVDICGCKVEMFAKPSLGEGYLRYQHWINALTEHKNIEREFFIESPLAHPSVLFHRKVTDSLGGYQCGDFPEDYDLWCRALLAGYKFGKPNASTLLQWRDYPERTSRQDPRYRKQGFINCKARTLTPYLCDKGITSAVIWGIGPTGLKLHDALEAEGFGVSHFVDINPKKQGIKKRGKPVIIITNIESATVTEVSPQALLKPKQISIIAVSARGAREKIREFLNRNHWTEGKNYLFAA